LATAGLRARGGIVGGENVPSGSFHHAWSPSDGGGSVFLPVDEPMANRASLSSSVSSAVCERSSCRSCLRRAVRLAWSTLRMRARKRA